MSLVNNGESCAYCKAKLFSDDDVVYCPVCGAPHHRECYKNLGHCALEELHGTENEYSREKELEKAIELEKAKEVKEKEQENETEETSEDEVIQTVRCKMCGEVYPYKKASCPKCGAPNFVKANGFVFDFFGGVPKDEEIAEDITADDVRKFVISNTHRYIPKFAKLKGKRKASWNWMAFLFPCSWFFSRKMHKGGFITGALLLITQILNYPVYVELLNLGVFDDASNYIDIFENVMNTSAAVSNTAIIISFLSIAITLAVRIISGVYGDYLYKKHTVSTIKKIRKESQNQEFDYRRKGGVNIFLFLLSYLALNYLSNLIFLLL